MPIRSTPHAHWIRLAAALAIAALGSAAQAAPAISGPSQVAVGQTVSFQGSGFLPHEALTVAITTPAGVESHHAVVATAAGTLQYKTAAKAPGMHRLRVLDSGGRQRSELNFVSP